MSDIDRKKAFLSQHPNGQFLEMDQPTIDHYLADQQWLENGETITSIEKPGEGNMNFVVRVKTNKRTFILKQARPFVEKYPQIAAPIERIASEAAFVSKLAEAPELRAFSPAIYHYDQKNFALIMEDLGEGTDYSGLYKSGVLLTKSETIDLIDYLNKLHRIPVDRSSLSSNMDMRRLNHEHIFRYPFDPDNGFDLDQIQPGLGALSLPYKNDDQLKALMAQLGEVYLDPMEVRTLVHGDFYPGSWLKVPSGLKVIDPEFGFVGRAEFDLGVFLAHLSIAGHPEEMIAEAFNLYHNDFDKTMMYGFAGTEILRRLIGVAQLPLTLGLDEKEVLLNLGRSWIIRE